jgi:cytochrome c
MLASSRRRRSRADPQAFISANRMPYTGIANVSDRADLVAYLLKATK